ncbi:MAG: TlpA disulfide reductase family protein [Saprospiraceae bacterium]
MKYLISAFFSLVLGLSLLANADGAHLKIHIQNYDGSTVYLVKYLGDKAYIKDTLQLNTAGQFVYESEEKLKSGMYYIVVPPKNEFVELLITEEEQDYTLEMDHAKLTTDLEFKNAPENSLLQEYRVFMQSKAVDHQKIMAELEEAKAAGADGAKSEKRLQSLRAEVKKFQRKTIDKQPKSLAATIVKTQKEPDYPVFAGEEAEQSRQQFWFAKQHFFDPFEDDKRLFTSHLFYGKVEQYFEKYTFTHPDSLNVSIDKILQLVTPDEEAFRFYYLKFLNKYLQSDLMGMDAVVVHLVRNYMQKGKADFIAEDKRKELIEKADLWEPILIGKIAPDFRLYNLDVEGTLLNKNDENPNKRFQLSGMLDLYQVKSPFTLLVFWSNTCGHCKKTMPQLVEFYEKYKAKGLEVLAVCDKGYKEYPGCAQALKDWGALKWYNAVDPYLKYKLSYDVDSTPKMYLLDQDKKILLKGNLKIESLGELMDSFVDEYKEGRE